MKTPTVKLLLLVAGVIAYDFLFWGNLWGINALLFTVLMLIYLFIAAPAGFRQKKTLITAAGTLLAGILVVTHSSVTSIVALLISAIVTVGFCFQPQLRSVAGAIPTGYFNFIFAPFTALQNMQQLPAIPGKAVTVWNGFRVSIIPVFVCFLFYLIYSAANPVFNTMSADFFGSIGEYFGDFFKNISWGRLFFILLGIVIIAGFLVNSNIRFFNVWDNKLQDNLEPEPVNLESETGSESPASPPFFSIQDEYKMGMILLILINALILIVNVIDINWLWHKVEFSTKLNLSQLVHEGTYLLILSILLSIGIMVFIFRGTLNYHRESLFLRYLAYAWIIQNAVMVVSVVIRNYHYMYYFGLAYKRIGVFVFLSLTLFGLAVLAVKIYEKKTLYYLIRTFSWAVYAMVVSISVFNWDQIIAKHNTTHQFPDNMDMHFLLDLSDKSLHIIAQNDKILDRYIDHLDYKVLSYERQEFNRRVEDFMERKSKENWREWNYPEHVAYNYFLEHKQQQNE